jgi:hypothetical protein
MQQQYGQQQVCVFLNFVGVKKNASSTCAKRSSPTEIWVLTPLPPPLRRPPSLLLLATQPGYGQPMQQQNPGYGQQGSPQMAPPNMQPQVCGICDNFTISPLLLVLQLSFFTFIFELISTCLPFAFYTLGPWAVVLGDLRTTELNNETHRFVLSWPTMRVV